jgi:hypothetical protein
MLPLPEVYLFLRSRGRKPEILKPKTRNGFNDFS